MSNFAFRAVAAVLAAGAAAVSFSASAACTQWRIPRDFIVVQGNGPRVTCTLTHNGARSRAFSGACKNGRVIGEAKGVLDGRRFTMDVDWGGAFGKYTAFLDGDGDLAQVLDGRTFDASRLAHWSTWTSPTQPTCRSQA